MKLKIFGLAALLTILVMGCSKDEIKNSTFQGTLAESTDIYGIVTDSNGNRLQGVVVSDGYTCTQTDENGEYQLTSGDYSYQVYVSVPEAYEVPMDGGMPCFWQLLTKNQQRYDFTLTPLSGGVETTFRLFCVADPQCQSSSNVDRYKGETVPDIASMVASSTVPCYGVALGDIGWNTSSTDYNATVFPLMKKAMSEELSGLPLFQIIGNHDNKKVSGSSYTVDLDIDAQRNFEYLFGPVNYSFNRGNVHFVCMDDILFTNHDSYSLGFRDDQVEWLKQDLSYVSKDKLLIFCVHMPLRAQTGSSYKNVANVFSILDGFSDYYQVMTGHVHTQTNYEYDTHYEHNHGSACGAWWRCNICADGSPNGYAIYDINGTDITNWVYKGTGLDQSYQIRLYKANLTYMPGYTPNYQFAYTGDNQIIANIWNYDSSWTVEVYENGSYSGTMTKYSGRDAWASGYLLGVLGRATGSDYDKSSVDHLFYYTLKDADASVEVHATDGFGNVYKQNVFTSNQEVDYPAWEE